MTSKVKAQAANTLFPAFFIKWQLSLSLIDLLRKVIVRPEPVQFDAEEESVSDFHCMYLNYLACMGGGRGRRKRELVGDGRGRVNKLQSPGRSFRLDPWQVISCTTGSIWSLTHTHTQLEVSVMTGWSASNKWLFVLIAEIFCKNLIFFRKGEIKR